MPIVRPLGAGVGLRRLFPAALALALLLSACGDRVGGSGQSATEQRSVDAFTKLDVRGAINAAVTIGSPQAVSVTGDSNIVPIITTEVRGSTLVVEPGKSYRARTPVTVTITVPSLTDIKASGASTVTLNGAQANRLAIDANGASTVRVSGTVDSLDAEASGASSLRFSGLAAREADVDASGASTIELQVSGTLTGRASGASSVLYSGPATTVKVDASGSSSVKRQ